MSGKENYERCTLCGAALALDRNVVSTIEKETENALVLLTIYQKRNIIEVRRWRACLR